MKKDGILSLAVIVAALGYFVDIYDLLLFTIVREPSLRSINVAEADMVISSTKILNYQMIGLLIGGIIWGVLGDRKGRLSVLFGSILLYSAANFITGYIQTVDQYAWARFVAGLGLAGELGAGITLVSELLPKEKRGIGTSLVAGIGLSGAVAAYYTFQLTNEDWRLCYKIGGGLGLILLVLRIKVSESGMFTDTKDKDVSRGNFMLFFNKRARFNKYLKAILIGLPTWYVIGILINLSNRFNGELNNDTLLDSGRAIMFGYIGLSVGDISIGLLSQVLKSRRQALLIFYGIITLGIVLYFSPLNTTHTSMYAICGFLGFGAGFWAIFVTMGAEQFGTNIRATAATTIPNMVRGGLVLMNFLLIDVFHKSFGWSLVNAGILTGVVVMIVSTIAAFKTEETFHKDLDYIEE